MFAGNVEGRTQTLPLVVYSLFQGGDLDEVTGKRCTFMALPWRWPGGDGCMVRVLAVIDPDQTFRFETGQ